MSIEDEIKDSIKDVKPKEAPQNNNVQSYNAVVQEVESEKPQHDPFEQQAVADGWAPKDKWRGNPEDWVDSKTFVERGRVMRQNTAVTAELKQTKAELEQIKNDLKAFQETNQKIIQKDYEAILGSLKTQRADAIRIGDGDAVNDLDDKIDAFKKDAEQATVQPAPEPELNVDKQYVQEYYDFTEANPWYATKERVESGQHVDFEMTNMAEAIGKTYYVQQQQANKPEPLVNEVIDHINTRLRQMYPDRFADTVNQDIPNPRPTTPPSSFQPSGDTGNPRVTNNPQGMTIDDIPAQDQGFYRRMADASNMDVNEYVKQVDERGGFN